eukprot:1138155-Pelagomonas_calceolata.AAC.3
MGAHHEPEPQAGGAGGAWVYCITWVHIMSQSLKLEVRGASSWRCWGCEGVMHYMGAHHEPEPQAGGAGGARV